MSTVSSNTVEISQDILDSSRLTIHGIKQELALSLYANGRLSIGKAHELAEMSLWQFRQLLASRNIPPHVDIDDLDEDLTTLQELNRI